MRPALARRQKGVTLIVGLILLILITLMVTMAFTLNTANLKSIGNMQFRNESIAAANKAIEQVIGTNFPIGFTSVPPAQTLTFDINNDGTADYTVAVAVPTCVQATQVAGFTGGGACCGARAPICNCGTPFYSTMWDVQATVTDALSGANVVIRQGFRMEVDQTQLAAVCP